MPTQFYPDGSVRQAMTPEEAQQQAANEYAANRPWDNHGATPIYDMFGPVGTGDPKVEEARAKATQTYDRNIALDTAQRRRDNPRFGWEAPPTMGPSVEPTMGPINEHEKLRYGNVIYKNLGLDTPEKIDAEVLKPFREAYGGAGGFKPDPFELIDKRTAARKDIIGTESEADRKLAALRFNNHTDEIEKRNQYQMDAIRRKETGSWLEKNVLHRLETHEYDYKSASAELVKMRGAGVEPDSQKYLDALARKQNAILAQRAVLDESLPNVGTNPLVINPGTGTLTNAPTLGAPPPFAPQTRSEYVVGRTYKGGLKYLGGDPQLQTSWQQVQ